MSDTRARLLTTQQVAQYCGVSIGVVEVWLQTGRLSGAAKDSEYRVRAVDLVHFMQQNHLAVPAELVQAEHANEAHSALVLVVDGDRPMAMNIERVLRNMGLGVIQASDGVDASATYIERKPQLMTLDLTLEGMNGVELIEHIRASQGHRAKILVITDSMPSLIGKARQAGADAVLNKPFDNDALRRNVRILLGLD